ncbi:MAG TPA: hypothetical protein VNE39_28020 [Planctomycetota bacterium]|nr:hypothetical protein [Planctomycetota bacterium]
MRLCDDRTSQAEVFWIEFHGLICVALGATLAWYCFGLYKTMVTPEWRTRNFAAFVAWVVVAVAGAGMMVAAWVCPVYGPRRPYSDQRKGLRGPISCLVRAEALLIAVPVFVVPFLAGTAFDGGQWVLTCACLAGGCLILNFILLLIGVT